MPQKRSFIRPGSGHPVVDSLHAASALGNPLVFLCPKKAKTFADRFDDLAKTLERVTGTLYLLVDGLSGRSLLADLTQRDEQVFPLFPEDTDADLLEAAPRLVTCSNRQAILENFHTFWGKGMASIVVSTAGTNDLILHLKQNLYVEDPDGELCILRFYDPRVLCMLGETLSDDQLMTICGDVIDLFVFENAQGELCQLSRSERSVA
jgi:hypothetical protein